jgi:molybdopterin-containing oxidoreductase family iron-sulfur binding subunit
VRRFNFFQYADKNTPVIQLMYNPDVTVRDRGVMEKCTYCVQRINEGRIEAERENRQIQDGEVRTACQQVCPTEAIVFGDINNPKSAVRQLKSEPLHYGLLSELGTQPRTSYGPRLRNPNPEIEKI